MAGKVAKAAYDAKMLKLLREYSQVLVVSSDNVGSNQLQGIRRGLNADSVVVMGKNSMMKRSIILDAQKTGNKAFLNLVPLLVVTLLPHFLYQKINLIIIIVKKEAISFNFEDSLMFKLVS